MVKVINTRPADRNGDLTRLLRQAGFDPVELPCVSVEADEEGLKRIRALSPAGYTGIFLSSPNGLKHLQVGLLATEFERWAMKPFYLVGRAARGLVESAGGKVEFVPQEASLEGFLKEYRATPGPGLPLAQRWLHPCSASTRLDPAAFKAKAIRVENMPVYRPASPKDLAARLSGEGRDAFAVVFCSGSAVENFFAADPEGAARLGHPKGPLAVSIGPSTSKALQDKGVPEIRQALHADDASLVDVLKAASGGAKTEVLKSPPLATRPAASGIPAASKPPESKP